MSIRPTEAKDPLYEPSEQSNMSESEIKKAQVQKKFYFMILFMVIDFIITICIILHESGVFTPLALKNCIIITTNNFVLNDHMKIIKLIKFNFIHL